MEKILILGCGKSAFGAYNLLKDKYDILFSIDDNEEINLPVTAIKKKNFSTLELNNYKFAIRSPGIPYNDERLLKLKDSEVEILSEIEVSYRYLTCKKLIAVTGSNGKTTVVSWLSDALTRLKIPHVLCGNIGIPFSNLVQNITKDSIVILEVSSFQLENISKFHPDIAVITNITENHLDKVPDYNYYAASKLQIHKNMNRNDTLIALPLTFEKFKIKGEFESLAVDKIEHQNKFLIGEHNQINYAIVAAILAKLKINYYNILNEFQGVPFRLQLIKKYKKCLIYNDGKSTSVDSTVAAVNSLLPCKLFLILGGRNKDLDFLPVFKLPITKIVVYGELGNELKNINHQIVRYNTLTEVIEELQAEIESYDCILYSPGCASFDQYLNYEERSKEFNRLIEENFYE